MADNVVANAGAGGSTFATDDIGGVHYPRSKVTWGPDGTANDADVASGKPLPVQIRSSGGAEAVLIDNAGFTDGTTPVQPAGYIFDEVAGTALTENDAAAARIDSKRAQVFTIEDETTRGRRTTVTAANALKVDNSGVTQPVSNAGTFAVQPAGSVAHDGVGTGVNPVLIGGYASATAPTDVAGGDAVRAWRLLNGAAACVLTAAGALIGGDATNGLDVDVTRIVAALPAGTNNIGDVDVLTLPALAAGTNNIGDVDVLTLPAVAGGAAQDAAITGNPVPVGVRASSATPTAMSADGDVVYPWATREGAAVVVPAAHAIGGATPGRIIDFSITNQGATVIKASAGKLLMLLLTNSNAAICYVKLYDKATAPTSGDTPVLTIPVPGNTAGAGVAVPIGDIGIAFASGIAIRATTGIADNNTSAVAASEVVANYSFK